MPAEFDCAECGSHIVDIIADEVRYPAICAQCLFLPGWYTDPELRRILGPEAPAALFAEAADYIAASAFLSACPGWVLRIFGWLGFPCGGVVTAPKDLTFALDRGEHIMPANKRKRT